MSKTAYFLGGLVIGIGVTAASFWIYKTYYNPEGMPCNENIDCKNPLYGCLNGKCTIHGP